MNKIERYHVLQKETLSKTHFFEHLMMQISGRGLLSEVSLQKVQLQLVELLAERIEKYNNGRSTSIKKEKANGLTADIYYTLGYYFSNLEQIDDSLQLLEQQPIKSLFEKGKQQIEVTFNTCKVAYETLRGEKLPVQNIAYNDTIDQGIGRFFEMYNINFESHEIPADIDYPLSLDKMDEVGVTYIQGYLKKLKLENDFCRRFNSDEITQLLKVYHEGSEHLLMNIYEKVLMNAVGNSLLQKEGLLLTEEDIFCLYSMLQPGKGLESCLSEAVDKLIKEFGIIDRVEKQYMYATVHKCIPIILNGLEHENLGEVFIMTTKQQPKHITLKSGHRLSDESFKKLTTKMMQEQNIVSKIALIKSNITNVEDLRDLLEAECLFEEEFGILFSQLSDLELAILVRFNMMDQFGAIDLEESEYEAKLWKIILNQYLVSLDNARKQEILALANQIQ